MQRNTPKLEFYFSYIDKKTTREGIGDLNSYLKDYVINDEVENNILRAVVTCLDGLTQANCLVILWFLCFLINMTLPRHQ